MQIEANKHGVWIGSDKQMWRGRRGEFLIQSLICLFFPPRGIGYVTLSRVIRKDSLLDKNPKGEWNQLCADLVEEHSRQREKSVQMLYGRKCLGIFEAQN